MKTNENKIILEVNGMTCSNCAKGINKHLEENGFNNIDINFLTREAICYIQDEQSKNTIINIIKKLGYDTKVIDFRVIESKKIKKISMYRKYNSYTEF